MKDETGALVIRRAAPDQFDQIRDLTMRAYAKWVSVTPQKPRPMTADYQVAVRENRFDLLYADDRLAGLIETSQQDGEMTIINVAVEPHDQGKGYGTKLIRYVEDLARASDLRATRLYTNQLMTENIALYERLGYRFEKKIEHDFGTIAVHMVRPVT